MYRFIILYYCIRAYGLWALQHHHKPTEPHTAPLHIVYNQSSSFIWTYTEVKNKQERITLIGWNKGQRKGAAKVGNVQEGSTKHTVHTRCMQTKKHSKGHYTKSQITTVKLLHIHMSQSEYSLHNQSMKPGWPPHFPPGPQPQLTNNKKKCHKRKKITLLLEVVSDIRRHSIIASTVSANHQPI